MSAKLLHALSDENPDLQKQIGCMTGIFQLFDRQHILAPKRIASYSSHKRPPSGHSQFSNSNHGDESNNVHTTKEKGASKNVNDNHRLSMESARASFSSSTCSSSFSSVEYNKPAQSETSSFDRSINSDLAWREPTAMQAPVSAPSKKSSDFRDMVKDSIYKETRSLSVKTSAKEEPVSHVMKHRDSPRPLQISRSVNGSVETVFDGKHKILVDVKDSLNVLGKLQETPRFMHDTREPARSSYEARERSSFSVPKETHRFSYDGRETPRPSFESGDNFKSTTKLRELPRLSLDSRASSMRGSESDVKSNSFLREFQRASGNSNRTSSTQHESENHKPNHSVVAKLMGLEAMPKSVPSIEGQNGETKACSSPGDSYNSFSRPGRSTNDSKQASCTPRSSLREIVSPRLRNSDAMKPLSTSRFPIEPAPWKQTDGVHAVQKSVFRSRDSPPRGPIASPSVYAEIEKRLKELEFKQSDRDLRALKQILDAMQAKGLLETKKKEDRVFVSERNYGDLNQNIIDQNLRLARRSPIGTNVVPSTNKVTSSPRIFESPIVIMKPARFIEKLAIPDSSVLPIEGISNLRRIRSVNSMESKKSLVNDRTAKDLTPKLTLTEVKKPLHSTDRKASSRDVKPTHGPARSQQLPRENTVNTGRSSGSISPRLQQKKLGPEKQSRPSSPSSDLSKTRKVSLRQATDSGSPGGKRRPRSPSLQQNDDQLSEISGETRIISRQADEVSLRSDSSISLVSQMDIEVTSSDRSGDSNNSFFHQGIRSSPKKVANNMISSLKQKKSSPMPGEDGSEAEFLSVAPEQPSPVSVLDASFYSDDLPSPDRKISEPFKVAVDYLNSEDRCKPMSLDNLLESKELKVSSTEINWKKLESVEQLVQKLRRLNSNHNEATTDYIASLCENTNPDHRYISEILLASGLLLRDLGSGLSNIQVHKSGYPVNPDLFLVLEQTKASNGALKDRHHREEVVQSKSNQEKVHRKLVFDSVNEILETKLASHDLYYRANKLVAKTLNGQQLLKELCSAVEQLQTSENLDCSFDDADDFIKNILCRDVMSRTEKWVDFSGENSAIVLDVERSIFKDLVDEVISGEAVSLRTKGRRCRQLFVK